MHPIKKPGVIKMQLFAMEQKRILRESSINVILKRIF